MPSSWRGSFVASYDPSAFGGRGDLELTKDWSRARLFPTRREAWEYWQQSYGERPDGKPNRPLTAFTCTILTLSQAVLEAQAG